MTKFEIAIELLRSEIANFERGDEGGARALINEAHIRCEASKPQYRQAQHLAGFLAANAQANCAEHRA